MASIGILFFFAVIHVSVGNAGFVALECKTENVGCYGQKSLLECFINRKNGLDPQVTLVIWKHGEEVLLVFHKGTIKTQLPGYSFAAPSWNKGNMNVSLLIANTTLQHQGDYTCEVITTVGRGGDEPTHTSLNVTAEYKEPEMKPSESAEILNPEILPPNTSGTPGGLAQGEQRDSITKVAAPLLVVGSLMIGLLMTLLIYRCRSQRRLQAIRTGELEAQEAEHLETNTKYHDGLD